MPVGGLKTLRGKSLATLGALLLLLASIQALPVRADLLDDLADKLFDLVLAYAGINPDMVEMARYAIKEPENASKVFSHAVGQDYPFFAIVGAVKAAKGKSLPVIGVFGPAACLKPITVIDDIFGTSANYIDDGAAKARTSGVVNVAKQYAVAYAKEQNAAAKQQVMQELTDKVPYFGELPLICNFAFGTSFKAEKNLQQMASNAAKELTAAYKSFAAGEIGDGAGHLVSAGVSGEAACRIADEAISGGLIGKTPVLGDIATGLCNSFAGKAIKGIAAGAKAVVNKGKEFVEDAACTVAGLFGGCEEAAPPPPPTGIGNATAFCAPFGGLKAAISKTNAPDDFSVICNDGSACIAKPGQAAKCQTAARKALSQWAGKFWGTWTDKCEDDPCRNAMPPIRDAGFVAGIKAIAAQPTIGWPALNAQIIAGYDKQAADEIAASKARSAAFNKKTTAAAADGWVELTIGVWSKKCWDQQCRNEIAALAADFGKALVAAQTAEPDASSLSIQGKVGKVFGPKFQAIVDASNKRKIIADPNAPAEAKLGALGCKYFLGRAQEWLCPADGPAFAICTGAVKAGKALLCLTPQLSYGTDEIVAGLLKPQGCIRIGTTGLVFSCPTPAGKEVCGRFAKGGMAINCAAELLAVQPQAPVLTLQKIAPPTQQAALPPASQTPQAGLTATGCQKIGATTEDWLCPDGRGFIACVAYVRSANQIVLCMRRDSQARYATNPRAIAFLGGQGCQPDGTGPLGFTCTTPQGLATCQSFGAGGMGVSCKPFVLKVIPGLVQPQVAPVLRLPPRP